MARFEELLREFEACGRSCGSTQALMQRVSDRLHEEMTRYNWVGFYLMERDPSPVLVVGPYAGSFSPTLRIPLDKGLCGAAATTGKTVVVNDVPKDPRYLGSDMVKSNLVALVLVDGQVAAELCVESYFANAFDSWEQRFIESCAGAVSHAMENGGSVAPAKPATRRGAAGSS